MKVFLPGGAGLVGLNLIALLQSSHPDWELLVVDKKREAVAIAKKLFPRVSFLLEDLTQTDSQQWPMAIRGCGACVMLQAEIGNTDPRQFVRNNVRSTEVVLEQLRLAAIPRLVHVSSSVVNSVATDLYTQTKRSQEELVLQQWPDAVVLRPTLMFGWFDRKHLGWLAQFMLLPFPIPIGRFIRQPLYVGDFCMLISAAGRSRSARRLRHHWPGEGEHLSLMRRQGRECSYLDCICRSHSLASCSSSGP